MHAAPVRGRYTIITLNAKEKQKKSKSIVGYLTYLQSIKFVEL